LCPFDLIERVRAEMKAPNLLHVVEGGDHSLLVSKRHLHATNETRDDVDQRILETIAQFCSRYLESGGTTWLASFSNRGSPRNGSRSGSIFINAVSRPARSSKLFSSQRSASSLLPSPT